MSLVYYHPETDTIFESSHLDVHFLFLLAGINWDKIEILGEL